MNVNVATTYHFTLRQWDEDKQQLSCDLAPDMFEGLWPFYDEQKRPRKVTPEEWGEFCSWLEDEINAVGSGRDGEFLTPAEEGVAEEWFFDWKESPRGKYSYRPAFNEGFKGGLKECIEVVGGNYDDLLKFIYYLANLAGKGNDLSSIVDGLDRIYDGQDYY